MVEQDLSPRTGSRRFIYEATRRLLAKGHDVKIFTHKLDRETCFKELLTLPIEVVSISKSTRWNFPQQTILGRPINLRSPWSRAKSFVEIGRRIESLDADIVLFHYTGEHWFPPYFCELRTTPLATCFHVFPQPRPQGFDRLSKLHYYLPPISRWKASSLSRLKLAIAHSKYVAERVRQTDFIGSAPIKLIPLGVNQEEYYPTGEEEPFVLYVGRIHPSKNLELIVRMLARVPSVHLVIAGDIEDRYLWYKEKLLKIAHDSNISNRLNIITFPSQDEIIRLMQSCTVFLFPSPVDTFGMVVLEAMACAKPVIACNSGGVPEIVGDCGFLLKPEPKLWAKTLKQLLSDSGLRKEIGKKAYKRSQLFSWDQTVDSLVETLQQLVA